MFQRTTAINKILEIPTRKKIIQGGTSAGKTFGIIPILIDIAIKHPRKEISIVSESYPHLRRGAMKDFMKIMNETLRWNPKEWHGTLGKYTFSNGSYIEFFSADSEARLRGARRNILYVNEANGIPFQSYYQLAIRTDEDIFLDFNPSMEFWAHTEVEPDEDASLIVLTYKDNEALSQTIITEIELAREKGKYSEYWRNWWQVYGLGQIGNLMGAVFDNWTAIDKIPTFTNDEGEEETEAKLLGYGLDFGYSSDPNAVVAFYQWNGKIIVDEMLCKKGMSNKELAIFLKENCLPGVVIIADSAEPKSIDEIFGYGVNIYGAKKGVDSITFSIQLLQQYEILVTKSSLNLIKEFRGYLWATDRSGNTTNKPLAHVPDHLIDAMRYIAMDKLGYTDDTYSIY